MTYRPAIKGILVLMLIPLLVTVLGMATSGGPPLDPEPPSSPARCIQNPQYMRLHHMEYLRDLREAVVRDADRSGLGGNGERGIGACGTCHVEQSSFCDRCHTPAGVQLDCFDCHDYRSSPVPNAVANRVAPPGTASP